MARFYSHYHSLATFISKCIPKRGSGIYHNLFVHEVLDGLKRLDAVQRSNPSVTLPFDIDGINVFYMGRRACRIMPAQKSLLAIFADEKLEFIFDQAAHDGIFRDSSKSNYRSWIVPSQGLEVLWRAIEALPFPAQDEKANSDSHPRYFSAVSRLAAYEAFQRDGLICPGFGHRSKHKVDIATDRLEYDHILPFAKGGSSSGQNVRIMCESCNRLKGANVA